MITFPTLALPPPSFRLIFDINMQLVLAMNVDVRRTLQTQG